jgi:hypothetical protein
MLKIENIEETCLNLDFNLNLRFDASGMSVYTDETKLNLLNQFLEKLVFYKTIVKPIDQKSSSIPTGSEKCEMNKEDIRLIISTLSYNLYVFGTFKFGQIMLYKVSEEEIPSYFFFSTVHCDVSSGVMQSVLSEAIREVASRLPNVKNNLEKMLNNNGYQLESTEKKKDFFGKGHLNLKGQDKINAKKDLNTIFSKMMENKLLIKDTGINYKINFDGITFNYFKITKFNK